MVTDPLPLPLGEPAAPRDPPWGWRDIALFAGVAAAATLFGSMLALIAMHALPEHVRHKTILLISAQSVSYVISLAGLYAIVVRYGVPFWLAMRWSASLVIGPGRAMLYGFGASLAVALLGALLRAPKETPMKDLVLADWRSLLLVLVVSVTIGPLFEELVFRGFLQPLAVRSLGPLAGIVIAALPFGLLHLQQYGFNWQHGVLITLAGAAFGWVRHHSGSTLTSTIMHIAYNSTVFLALVTDRKELPTRW
jgi:membrane protease YdiL (CAAX protease family)